MKIIHLSNTPLSRAPYNIAACQNQCGHEARVLLQRDTTNTGIKIGGGEYWTVLGKSRLHEMLSAADIVHMHNFAWELAIFKAHPELVEVVKKKPYLLQYHSDRRATENFETTIKDPEFRGRRAVLAQYHAAQYPEADYLVGNPLPLFEACYKLVNRSNMRPVVSFAPSNMHIMKGYDYKGADKIVPVIRSLVSQRLVDFDLITGVPFEECVGRKRFSDIGVEELISGSYHLSFLEYMALGVCTVGNVSYQTLCTLKRLIGEDALEEFSESFMDCGVDGLSDVLKTLLCDRPLREGMAKSGREWILKYWSPEFHVRIFDDVYSRL